MKKILNDPNNYADEALEGMCMAHPEYYTLGGESGRVIHRPSQSIEGKVGIVSGGGSGHLPLFAGYCGEGLLDACSVGNVFAGPSVADCIDAMKIADSGAGVLSLYGNYGGDRMNFDMAGEMLELEGVETATVLVAGAFSRVSSSLSSLMIVSEAPVISIEVAYRPTNGIAIVTPWLSSAFATWR